MSEAFCFCSSTRYLSSFKWLLDRKCDKWYSLQIERNRHTANVLLIISIDFANVQLSPYSLTILFKGYYLYKLQLI